MCKYITLRHHRVFSVYVGRVLFILRRYENSCVQATLRHTSGKHLHFVKTKKNDKYLIYIAPFHIFFIASKALYNCKYHPSLGHSLYHSFVRRSHLLPDQLPGEHTCHKAAISWLPNGVVILLRMHIFFHLPSLPGTNFTPWWGRRGVHILPKDVTWSVNWQNWDSNPRLVHSESHALSIRPPRHSGIHKPTFYLAQISLI